MIEIGATIEDGDIHVDSIIDPVDRSETVEIRIDAIHADRKGLVQGIGLQVGFDLEYISITLNPRQIGLGNDSRETLQSAFEDMLNVDIVLCSNLFGQHRRIDIRLKLNNVPARNSLAHRILGV